MTIENMRRLLVVAQEKNISAAAQKLFISQPTLSQMIKTTEKEIGVTLFERRGKNFRLTDAGEKFVVLARKTVNSWNYYLQDMQRIKTGGSGKIVVCMTMRRSLSYLPVVIPEFLARFPGVNVEQVVYNAMNEEECLIQGMADLIFGKSLLKNPQVVSIPLCREHYMVIASQKSDFFRRFRDRAYEDAEPICPISLEDLAQEKLILLQSKHQSRMQIEKVAQTLDIPLRTIMDTVSVDTAIGLVKVGLGVTISPVVLTNRGVLCNRDQDLGYFFLRGESFTRDVFLSYEKILYRSVAHTSFIHLVREHFGKPGFQVENIEDDEGI